MQELSNPVRPNMVRERFGLWPIERRTESKQTHDVYDRAVTDRAE